MISYRAVALALALVSYLLLDYLIQSYRRNRRARELGCKRPPVRQNKLPGAVDTLVRLSKASKRDRVPDEFLAFFQEQDSDTWEQWILGSPQIFTTNPKNVQALLAIQFEDFEIGAQRGRIFFPMLGSGIFTADGKDWEHSRAMLRPQFTREQVADLEQEEIHVQHMFQHLQSDGSGWTSEVDLGPLFFRLTIDTATGFLFGQSVNSQLSSLPGQKDTASTSNELDWASFADHFDDGMAALGARGRLFNLYWLHNPRSFRDDCAGINRFADHFVQMALERDKNGIENPESSSREKQRYVFLQELVKVTKDPVVLRSQLLHVLLAGRDTTAGLLGWLCWNLARNPVVFQKLRETVLDTFGSYQNPREITFARLKSCSYLQYTLHESLRLFPSVPLNSRRATKDTSLPYGGGPDGQSPIFVRKGEEVNYSVYAMHRRKDLWGPDADVFNPDRWYNRKSTWEYLPFNGGPRICLGQQFALTEAGYVLTRLVQRFDRIESCDPISEIRHQYAVTSAPRRVLVRLHETKENPTK